MMRCLPHPQDVALHGTSLRSASIKALLPSIGIEMGFANTGLVAPFPNSSTVTLFPRTVPLGTAMVVAV